MPILESFFLHGKQKTAKNVTIVQSFLEPIIMKSRRCQRRRNGITDAHLPIDHLHDGSKLDIPSAESFASHNNIDLKSFISKYKDGFSPDISPGQIDALLAKFEATSYDLLAQRNSKQRRQLNYAVGMEIFDIHQYHESSSSESEVDAEEACVGADASKSSKWTEEMESEEKQNTIQEEEKVENWNNRISMGNDTTFRRRKQFDEGKPLGFTSKESTFRRPEKPRLLKKQKMRRKKKKNQQDDQCHLNESRRIREVNMKKAQEKHDEEFVRSQFKETPKKKDVPKKKNRYNLIDKMRDFLETLFVKWYGEVVIRKREEETKAKKVEMLRRLGLAADENELISRLTTCELRLQAAFSAWVDYHIVYGSKGLRPRTISTEESELFPVSSVEPISARKVVSNYITLAERQTFLRPNSATSKFVNPRPLTPFKTGRRERFDAAQKGIWHGNPHIFDHYGREKRATREQKGIKVLTRNMVKKKSKAQRPYTVPSPPRCVERPKSAPMSTRLKSRKGYRKSSTLKNEEIVATTEVDIFKTLEFTERTAEEKIATLEIIDGDTEDFRNHVQSSVRNYAETYNNTRGGPPAENPTWMKAPVQYHSHGPRHRSWRLRRHQTDPYFESLPRMAQVKHNMALLEHWFGMDDEEGAQATE